MKGQKNKKIALLLEAPSVIGGIQSAAFRHINLIKEFYDVVPIFLENSQKEYLWAGKTETHSYSGVTAYKIIASDLKSDHQISQNRSIENIRYDMRFRSFADHIIDILKKEKVDLIHAFGAFHKRSLLAAFAHAKTNIPYLISFRGTDLETRVFENSLSSIQTSIINASGVVCVSDDSKMLVENLFSPKCPVYTVKNHFNPDIFEDTSPQIPLLKNNKLPVIGFFGKFRRVTGIDFLLKSFEQLNVTHPAILLLVGNIRKQEAQYYNKLLESNKCLHNIVRVSYVENKSVLSYYKLCDMVVFPSITDASPNKVLEAMYAKIPIISTHTGGIPELVTDGKEAILCPPRDEGALLKSMIKILEDQSFKEKLIANAYTKVTEEFKTENEKKLWLNVYEKTFS
jgi:glycosyltransferase involved in cell wall biosynthesis